MGTILSCFGVIVVILLAVAVIVVWVYVISVVTYRVCEKIGEYIERKFKGWF